jgi:hypothetical protein
MTHLSIWTVYDHPRDYPDRYVARQFIVTAGEAEPTLNVIMATDLETLRATLLNELHMHRIPRSERDDPVIVETWI